MGKKILVTDDDEITHIILSHVLQDFEVHHRYNGKECIDFLLHNNCDIVLLDIRMPVMDGITASKEIKKLFPNLPIISITAFDDNSLGMFDDKLNKPLKAHLLLEKINKLLNEK